MHEYHLKPWEVGELTPEQYRMLVDGLPTISYRKHLQTAEFMAAVLNLMGGKPNPNDKEAKTLPPERRYSGEDVLVYFAREPKPSPWTREAAALVIEHRSRLPKWLLDSLPMSEIEALTA